ncbi:MAG: hypothetical protein TEF_04530 [Rhizobiales bacterium NRL2]|jgi:ubiquinone/menaquinone biosynthesis C-methylase UbiE|nr:MAG: hypothetical protein TEF_04530 [Rhizobiales bacterium NRL2]
MADRDDMLARVYAADGDPEKLIESYDSWASSYDRDLFAMGYRHPVVVAGTLARFASNLDITVLDAGCGSGLLGEALSLLGYAEIVGIDLSEGMLEQAAAKACYADLQQVMLGEDLEYADGTFDAVVSAGVMTVGHAPPEALVELARVTKPGGHLVVAIVREAWESGFRDVAERLAADHKITPLYRTNHYVGLPGAPEAERVEARVHVMRRV